MIVVDSDVIAYCFINGERTVLAHRLRRLDADWHAPVLWRSELRNILTGYRRDGSLDEVMVRQIMAAAEAALAGREHFVPSERVFAVTAASRLSAYDAEFVALAGILGVTLVTEDRAILGAFPDRAINFEAAVESICLQFDCRHPYTGMPSHTLAAHHNATARNRPGEAGPPGAGFSEQVLDPAVGPWRARQVRRAGEPYRPRCRRTRL